MQMLWPWGSDAGYFLQRVWQGAHDAFAERTLIWNEDGAGTHGGKHHSPIISLYVPWLAMRPRYETLLWLQAAVLGAGVLPLFALCWRVCRDRATAIALLIAAVSVPGLIAIGIGDFRPVAPAVVLVPALVGAAVFGPWPAAFAATVLACSTREEVAPFVLAMLPLLVSERTRRASGTPGWGAWRVPLLAVGVPAVLWMFGTGWRAELLNPMASIPGLELGERPLWTVPLRLGGLLVGDLLGNVVDSPRMIVRQVQVAGLAVLLLALRPWAALPMLVMWLGGCLAAGVVNPGQIHYYAPLVGLSVALVPLGLGREGPAGQKRARAAATAMLVLHLALPWFQGPVSVREALWLAGQERLPEWQLAEGIADNDRVLASDWLLPTMTPRQDVWLTGDLNDRGFDPSDYDVALLVPDDPWMDRIAAAGFVEVDRRRQGVLLRREQ